MHMEGPEPQISGNAEVIIEFRAGEMTQERVQLGSRGHTLVLKRCGDQDQGGGRAQITSPGVQFCAEGQVLLSCGCSDGLLVTHVPDLSSLGLLVEQCKTSQIF